MESFAGVVAREGKRLEVLEQQIEAAPVVLRPSALGRAEVELVRDDHGRDGAARGLRQKAPKKAWLGASRVRVSGAEVLLDQPPAPNSPLYAAGVETGDRIVSIGRFEFGNEADWTDALERLKPDEATTVKFVQRGQTREAPLTVAADPTLEVVRYEKADLKPTEAQLAFRKAWLGADSEPAK